MTPTFWVVVVVALLALLGGGATVSVLRGSRARDATQPPPPTGRRVGLLTRRPSKSRSKRAGTFIS